MMYSVRFFEKTVGGRKNCGIERMNKREGEYFIMRMNVTKVLLSLMIMLVCMCNCWITVHADEEFEAGMTKEEVLEKYSVDTGNTQADEIFNQYLESASVMLDKSFADYINTVEILDSLYLEDFTTYCGGTAEEWEKMTTFEKVLWCDLIAIPMKALQKYEWDEALETPDKFYTKVLQTTYRNYSGINEELGEAYLVIMEWQYEYIVENSAVYNFMTGEDSLGNTKIDEIDIGEQQKAEESKEVSESIEESKQETSVKEESEEESTRDNTTDSAKSGWLPFAILGVVIVAILGAVIYRKFKGSNSGKEA